MNSVAVVESSGLQTLLENVGERQKWLMGVIEKQKQKRNSSLNLNSNSNSNLLANVKMMNATLDERMAKLANDEDVGGLDESEKFEWKSPMLPMEQHISDNKYGEEIELMQTEIDRLKLELKPKQEQLEIFKTQTKLLTKTNDENQKKISEFEEQTRSLKRQVAKYEAERALLLPSNSKTNTTNTTTTTTTTTSAMTFETSTSLQDKINQLNAILSSKENQLKEQDEEINEIRSQNLILLQEKKQMMTIESRFSLIEKELQYKSQSLSRLQMDYDQAMNHLQNERQKGNISALLDSERKRTQELHSDNLLLEKDIQAKTDQLSSIENQLEIERKKFRDVDSKFQEETRKNVTLESQLFEAEKARRRFDNENTLLEADLNRFRNLYETEQNRHENERMKTEILTKEITELQTKYKQSLQENMSSQEKIENLSYSLAATFNNNPTDNINNRIILTNKQEEEEYSHQEIQVLLSELKSSNEENESLKRKMADLQQALDDQMTINQRHIDKIKIFQEDLKSLSLQLSTNQRNSQVNEKEINDFKIATKRDKDEMERKMSIMKQQYEKMTKECFISKSKEKISYDRLDDYIKEINRLNAIIALSTHHQQQHHHHQPHQPSSTNKRSLLFSNTTSYLQ